jgi:hypothetical protein
MQLLTVCLLSSIGVDEDVQFEEASRLESSLDSSHHNILQVRQCLLCFSGVTVYFSTGKRQQTGFLARYSYVSC